jgi:hypothetical protein
VDVRLRCTKGVLPGALEAGAAQIVGRELRAIDAYARELLEGSLVLDGWPLRP